MKDNQPDIKLIVISPIYSNPKADGTDRNPDRLASQSFASSASPVLYLSTTNISQIYLNSSLDQKQNYFCFPILDKYFRFYVFEIKFILFNFVLNISKKIFNDIFDFEILK